MSAASTPSEISGSLNSTVIVLAYLVVQPNLPRTRHARTPACEMSARRCIWHDPVSQRSASFAAFGIGDNLGGYRIQLFGIDREILERLRELFLIKLALLGQRKQRRVHRVLCVDLEVPSKRRTRIAAAETIGAQRYIWSRHPRANLIGDESDVVADRNERARQTGKRLFHVTLAWLFLGVQAIPTLTSMRFAEQLAVTRHTPNVALDAELVGED